MSAIFYSVFSLPKLKLKVDLKNIGNLVFKKTNLRNDNFLKFLKSVLKTVNH